jgi:RNA-directed DNA polymerase
MVFENARYTRYADNLTFSADSDRIIPIARHAVERILLSQGFRVNHRKFKVMRQSSSQKIVGIVVNQKSSIPRKKRHEIRGRIENLFKDALNGKEINIDEWKSLEGFLAYAGHIDPAWADRFKKKLFFVRTHLEAKKFI